MKLRQLEMALEKLEGYHAPRAALEQYATPPSLAARLIYHALLHGDIAGCRVCDLGCGTGILACGAALLGASSVTGVDLDPAALAIAVKNARAAGVHVEFIGRRIDADLRDLGPFDTVVMNPPFGAQVRHADRPFIDAALMLAPVVWGIFNGGSRPFVAAYIEGRGEVTGSVSARLALERTFAFHRRERVEIPTEILRLERTRT
jgi:putative methylase